MEQQPTYAPVKTKADFVTRFIAGEFGNRPPVWPSIKEYLASDYQGLVHLRSRHPADTSYYDVPRYQVAELWSSLTLAYREADYYISAMIPKEVERTLLIQGEVCQTIGSNAGLALLYTTVALNMREALAERSTNIEGVRASIMLMYWLCPNSYEWLMELLNRYPQHVVEFSTYGRNTGVLPGFNTVFWEVRQY